MSNNVHLTIKQLRAFAAVADAQSFSFAARRLNLTPGAVSLLVQDLESAIGFMLFERTTRRVALSKAGRDYLPVALQVLRQVQVAVMAANDLKNQANGTVRVAAPQIVAHSMLPEAIAAYRARRPDVLVRPVDSPVESLVQMVSDEDADIAIGPDRPTDESVERVTLYDSPWVVWCSAQHPLAANASVTLPQLKGEAVIAAGRDYESRMSDALVGREQDRFVPTYVVDNVTTALGMVQAGLAVTVSPMYVGILASKMGLVMRPLRSLSVTRQFSLYRPGKRTLTPAAAEFLDFVGPYLVAHRFRAPRRKTR